MIEQNKISVKRDDSESLTSYVLSHESSWFYLSVLGIFTFFISILISNIFPSLIFIRYILGTIFALFIPGYILVKIAFIDSRVEIFEEIALSVGLSLAVTPSVSFLLNFTPWGITFATVSTSLAVLSILLGVYGVHNRYIRSVEFLSI